MEISQTSLWNGRAGRAWVEAQASLDRMFAGLETLLVEMAAVAPGSHVLDVGCGTGATTLALARRLGPEGSCVGVDLSAPMLELARARALREQVRATFVQADAQVHPFGTARFDRIVSRFGVMFFDDPVLAFANLARAAQGGAEMRFLAWRSAEENPFMTTAERAAAPLLPELPARRPGAPGQFAFADQRRVSAILSASGWSDVEMRAVDVPCTLPEPELEPYVSRFGPLGGVFDELEGGRRTEVLRTVRAAFAPYEHGSEVRFTAACWLVQATLRPR